MSEYRTKERRCTAFKWGSLDKPPDWLEAALFCGFAVRFGDHHVDGHNLMIHDNRSDMGLGLTAKRGDFLIWNGSSRRITVVDGELFSSEWELVE